MRLIFFVKFAGQGENAVVSLNIVTIALSGRVAGQTPDKRTKKRWDSGTLGTAGHVGQLGHVEQRCIGNLKMKNEKWRVPAKTLHSPLSTFNFSRLSLEIVTPR